MRVLSRWLFLWAMATMRLARSGSGPVTPRRHEAEGPAMEVNGVRSSG